MNIINSIFNLRIRILHNKFANVRSHSKLKILFVLFMAVGIIAGIFYVPYRAFLFLQSMGHLGSVIIERLMYLLFMGLFVMLIFSNCIICYSTNYRAKETDYFFSLPIDFQSIFFIKSFDSLVMSSWAFLCFLLPIMAAYALVNHLGLFFYVSLIVFFIPFAIIACCIGCTVTMFIVRFLPRKLYKFLAIIIGSVFAGGIVWMIITGKAAAKTENEFMFLLTNIIPQFGFTQFVFAPNYWISEGLFNAISCDYKSSLFWWLLLMSNALFLGQVMLFFSKKFYYPGWVGAASAGSVKKYLPGKSLSEKFSRRLWFVDPWMRSIIVKDIKVFWRDPLQWTQFSVFFGLLAIYFANIRNFGYESLIPFWKNIISFLNLSSTNLTLASLSVRFVFPQLSLEGKRFWILRLAPIKKESLLYEKFWLNSIIALFISLPLIVLSNLMLEVSAQLMVLSIIVVILMCFSLISLCVGLGAIFPNFKEDNPAQIVSGFGGTLALILCLLYIAVNVAALAAPYHLLATEQIGPEFFHKLLFIAGSFVFLLSGLTIGLSLFFGCRALKRLEL
ncbi:MAG: hypothetical protein ABII88_06330 [Candidatus Omnitrophota bacterium]